MKILVSVAVALALAGAASAQDAAAPPGPLDHTQQVGAWTVSDTGAKPGDDSDRDVKLARTIQDLELYIHRVDHDGIGLSMQFARCDGLNLNSGFSLDGDIAKRQAKIRAEVHDAFKDFAKSCPPKAGEEEALMDGFDAADRLLETWVHDRPFTNPPEEPDPKAAAKPKKKK